MIKVKHPIELKDEGTQEKKKNITGAEAIIQCLLAEGVDTIFGYPGGAIMPVYDALFHHMETLRHILPRHEQGGIHAAEGYARVQRKTGVVMVTSGPEIGRASCRGRAGASVLTGALDKADA